MDDDTLQHVPELDNVDDVVRLELVGEGGLELGEQQSERVRRDRDALAEGGVVPELEHAAGGPLRPALALERDADLTRGAYGVQLQSVTRDDATSQRNE